MANTSTSARGAVRKKKRRNSRWLHNKCMRLYSLWRRLDLSSSTGNCICITCGISKNYKEMHLGHFKHGVLDFDEMNRHPQCAQCNTFHSGRLDEYGRFLLKNYGSEKLEDLHIRASMAKKGEFYQQEYLESYAKELTDKITQLKKEKGI